MNDGLKSRLEQFLSKDGSLRTMLQEMKLPKEIISQMMAGIDETKHAAVGIIAKEVRQFLQQTDLAAEIAKLLTQVSMEVSIKFVPTTKDAPAPTPLETTPATEED